MYIELKKRLMDALKEELEHVDKTEANTESKIDKISQIKNVYVTLQLYEDIEPELTNLVNKHSRANKLRKGSSNPNR